MTADFVRFAMIFYTFYLWKINDTNRIIILSFSSVPDTLIQSIGNYSIIQYLMGKPLHVDVSSIVLKESVQVILFLFSRILLDEEQSLLLVRNDNK